MTKRKSIDDLFDAQRVFQGLTRLMNQGEEPQQIYAEAFRRISGLIDGSDPDVSAIEESLRPLRKQAEIVERGTIIRTQQSDRFAQYIIPLAVARDDDERAAYVPEFNEAISSKAVLWPQVRARWDAQRVCLVSMERKTGWFHDLWFPGYLWADTEGLWQVPGMTFHEMSRYEIQDDRLIAAFEELQRQEPASGQWGLGGTKFPFGEELQERFPLVGRSLDQHGQSAPSQLSPEQVAKILAGIFS